MKRILVAGGAGYIGSHTVYALADTGAEIIIADNLETGHERAVHPKARFYRGDIRDGGFLDKLLSAEKPDGVIHFAANSLVGESMSDPLKYYDNNVGGTRSLLAAMLRNGVNNIVFSSTAAVYGEPERVPILESDRTVPTNTYGETKLAIERMLHWASKAHGLNYVSLRYFNACGAHESAVIGEAHSPETHLIPCLLLAAAGKRDGFSLYGTDYDTRDGTCVRDYIHVSDLASAHILAMDYIFRKAVSDVFNLGNGVGFSNMEIISAAKQVINRDITIKTAPRRPGDPAQLVASSQKARDILGWSPRYTDIQEIVASAWHWHSSHPDGFDS